MFMDSITGAGLPPPLDYRDLPNLYRATAYRMDVDKLKARLKHARLILGLVEETVPRFLLSESSPDRFYVNRCRLLHVDSRGPQGSGMRSRPPHARIHCYFDDMMGFTFSEYTGERLAITEFNNSHQMRKISPIFGLKYFLPGLTHMTCGATRCYMAHIFDHDLYGHDDGLVIRLNEGFTALR